MLLFLPIGREHDTFKTLNEFLHIAYTIKRQREIHYVVFHFKKRLNETVKLIAANDLRQTILRQTILRQTIYDKRFTTNDFTTNDF
jgi:ribosomal protein S6